MPNIEQHPPGSFCWIELATTNQPAAKAFYAGLFGWQAEDMPMGPTDFYTMFRLEGRDAGAAYTLRPEQRSQGVPPHWMLYVAVESADAAAERAAQLGGKVLAPAFDVFNAGRMAVLQDPAGAAFSVWQPKTHTGTGITGVEGTLCWADLSTPDRDRVGPFYAALFGWTIGKEDENPEHAYWHLANGGEFIGGVPPATHRDPNIPAHWQVYFTVKDCDASAARAKELGAQFFLPPMTFENVGRMAVMADPQGAVFAIFQTTGRG
ncbi:MAG TPA: VOC family protein [Terriglobia bacterium]|nr:VOC family protein [Terriglobia bacterium]